MHREGEDLSHQEQVRRGDSSSSGSEPEMQDDKPLLRPSPSSTEDRPAAPAAFGSIEPPSRDEGGFPKERSKSTTRAGMTFDQVLDEIGPGRYQNVQIAILGLGNSADAVEILAIGYALTVYPGATPFERGALSAAVFAGMLVGGIALGVASDRIGRRKALLISLLVNGIAALASAFSPHTYVLIALRVVAGMGIGGSVPCVFTLGAEISPTASRGWYLNLVAWMWMVGSLFVVSASWILLGLLGASWRVLLAVSSLPAFLVFLLVLGFAAESPRWLYLQGRRDDAVAVLGRMARANGQADDWIARALVPARRTEPMRASGSLTAPADDDGAVASRRPCLSAVATSVAPLFGPRVRRTTLLLLVVWFTLAFANYGLLVWVAEIFDAVGFHVDKYQDAFLVAAANLPGNIAAALLLDTAGRRRVLSVAMLCACACAVGFAFIRVAPLTVAFACAFNAFSVAGWNALDCLSTESFPTSMRTAGMGMMAASGRIGSMMAQFVNASLIEHSVALMFVVMAAAMLVGSLSGAALPFEPSQHALSDTTEDDADAHATADDEDDEERPTYPVARLSTGE